MTLRARIPRPYELLAEAEEELQQAREAISKAITTLRNDLYKNRVSNALAILDDALPDGWMDDDEA